MSSLPPAKSQVAEKPSKNSVTQAVDPNAKQADAERASKVFGVVQAFREGRYPDNHQIDDALKYTLANSPIDDSALSKDGQRLVQDVREVIETARQMVMQKNQGEEFQNFLYATRKSDIANNVNVSAPISKEDAQKHGEDAGEAFRNIVTLFLRNGELRKIFQDLGYVGRDMFADGAAKAAEVARPDEEKLNQVDQPAPDNEFHDDIPGALQKKKAEAKAEEAKLKAKTDGADHAQDVANVVDPNASREQNQARLADKANEKAKLLSSKIPQEHKDKLKEQSDKTQEYLKEKFPKERRDQFIYRLKKVVVECQRQENYQDSVELVLSLFEQHKTHAANVHGQVTSSASQVRGESNVATAEDAFRRLIERFANGKPTQPMLDAIDQLYTDAKNDSELRDWFKRLDSYVRRALLEPGFIMRDEADTQARQLRDSGKQFFVAGPNRDQGKYVPHKDRLFKEVEVFFKAMGEDPLNVKLGEDLKRLVKDLFLDADGKPTFKPHLWSDVSRHIAPGLLGHIGQIPLPRMEYVDKSSQLVIEDLNIAPLNVLPNILDLESTNKVRYSAFKQIPSHSKHSLKLALEQIQLDMRDVHFFYRKTSGYPRLTEKGTADVFLGGKGLSVLVHIDAETDEAKKRSRHIFTVKSVKASIDKLSFALRDSKHDLLAKIIRPLATGLIKKSICKAVEKGIRDALVDLDRQMVELRDRAERNKEIEGKGFTDAFKETFQKEKSDSDKESKGTFKFVTSKRQSMLPEVGHPDGFVQKLDERDRAAKTSSSHKNWYSPAFNIVPEGQRDPRNTESSKTSGLGSRSAAIAGAGAAAGVGAAGLAGAAAHGAGQPGHTSTVYAADPAAAAVAGTGTGTTTTTAAGGSTIPTGTAPGAIVSPTGTSVGGAPASNLPGTTPLASGTGLTAGTGATAVPGGAAGVSAPHNGNSIYYQDDSVPQTKAAPAITNALPTTTTGATPNNTSTL